MPKGYKLVDPRPIAKEAPYTYFLPGPERMAALKPGDKIYVNFEAVPKRQKWDSERMWVLVAGIDGETITGTLDSQPDDLPALKQGDIVEVQSWHVVAVAFADPDMEGKFEFEREYWERCLVDQAIIDGGLKVEYLYREKPDMGPGLGEDGGDAYPDSGWRIRGDTRGCSDEEIQKREAAYVALGLVLNADDSWLHLIDAPVGSAFELDYDSGAFDQVAR